EHDGRCGDRRRLPVGRAAGHRQAARAARRHLLRRRRRGGGLHRPVDGVLPAGGRPVAPGGGARGGDRGLRRVGPQRRLVLGAVPDGRRAARQAARRGPVGGTRAAGRDAGQRRRGRPRPGSGGHRRRLGEGRDRHGRPDRGPAGARPFRGRAGTGVGTRRAAAPAPRRPRDTGAGRRPRCTRLDVHPGLRDRPPAQARPRPGPGRRAARGVHPRGHPGARGLSRAGAHRARHRAGRRRRPRHRGVHAGVAGPEAHGRARLLPRRRHRAVERPAVGGDRARGPAHLLRAPAPRRLRAAHRRRSARLRRTGRAVPLRLGRPPRARPRRVGLGRPARHPARPVPGAARRRLHPRLGRPARCPARLVRVGRAGPLDGAGVGRRVRRRRGHHDQPGRPDAARPRARARHRPGLAPLGAAPVTALGARAAALARDQRRAPGDDLGGRRGAADRPREPGRRAHGTPDRAL
ncbi:MAG: Glycine/D-amino acid oxidases (deaminating), partial [uncultured Nocardioidaceae bacterium]